MKKILVSLSMLLLLALSAFAQGRRGPQIDTVRLWPDGAPNAFEIPGPESGFMVFGAKNYELAMMEVYPARNPNGLCVIMCPGGAYVMESQTHEGRDLHDWFNARGITYCMLQYRLPIGHHEVPLSDLQQAIRAEQATVKAFIDDQNAQKLEAAIDEGFDALSDDLADVFGRGTGRKIEKAFLENREKALQQVAVLKAGYEATGQEYTLADLIRKAAMMLAPELVKTIPQNRKREFIAPPQKTEQTPLAGDDAAFEEFQKKYNELKPKE